MLQIRKSVFETNSSSTHSLVFSKQDRKTKYPLELDAFHQYYDDVENGLLCIRFGEFGWGPAILVDPRDKLNYLMTQIADEVIGSYSADEMKWEDIQTKLLKSKKVKDILKIVQKHVPAVKGFKFLRAGEDPMGDDPEFGYTYPVGYIDHQSWGTAHDVDPERLIFDDTILILIDNDNSCCFADYEPKQNWDFNKETQEWIKLPDTPAEKDVEDLFTLRGYDFDYFDRW